MATHSSILAYKIPWTEDPGGPQSIGSQRVRHNRATEHSSIKLATPYPGAPLIFWDGPHSVCRVCFYLNKSTSYPSLCLSLNSFCDETSRTWASLSPETSCVISVKRLWVQSLSGFWLDSSPSTWVQVSILVTWFHYQPFYSPKVSRESSKVLKPKFCI